MSAYRLPASAYEALGLSEHTVKLATTAKPITSPPPIASPNLLQNELQSEQRLAMNDTSIVLYAELLLHIRTVTLFASLRTESTRETKAKLESNGCAVTVTHEGASATISLPIQVQGGGNAALSLPASPPSKDLTLRLQIEEKAGSNVLGSLLSEDRKANVVPWDGASLTGTNDIAFHCQYCEEVIVPAGVLREWRDLPNENWAEMMDFWHCHKPDEHHLHDDTSEEAIGKKGYAAGNRLQATKGIGFVDLSSFLLHGEDCTGIESTPTGLHCTRCSHILGAPDPAASGNRVWKWCISSSEPIPHRRPVSFPPQKWIAARLLHLIENQNIRRFHVHPPSASSASEPTASLHLWIFTPDLYFASSTATGTPTRAMKVFWKRETWTAPRLGEAEKVDEEEIEVADKLFEELKSALERSQDVMPTSARQFQGWQVGLLVRFDVGELGWLSADTEDVDRQKDEGELGGTNDGVQTR